MRTFASCFLIPCICNLSRRLKSGATSCLFGFPLNGTVECTVQAFLINFFFPASWIWTSFLVYQLRCAVLNKHLWFKIWHMHVICWPLSLLVSCLPLSTLQYGQDDALSGQSNCFFSGKKAMKYTWADLFFNIALIACFFFMTYRIVEVILFLRRSKEYLLNSIYISMRMYPLGMAFVWGPVCLYNVVIRFDPRFFDTRVNDWLILLATQSGTVMAVIFFSRTGEARRLWQTYCCESTDDEIYNSSESSLANSSQKVASNRICDADDIMINYEGEEARCGHATSEFGTAPLLAAADGPTADYIRFEDTHM